MKQIRMNGKGKDSTMTWMIWIERIELESFLFLLLVGMFLMIFIGKEGFIFSDKLSKKMKKEKRSIPNNKQARKKKERKKDSHERIKHVSW